MAKQAQATWGGRFSAGPAELMLRFSESVSFDRRLAPFHPVNTTVAIEGRAGAVMVLTVMERMLVPDEDPALAYWRWWITGTLEGADLLPGAANLPGA